LRIQKFGKIQEQKKKMLWNNKKGFYDSKVQATFKSLELLLRKAY
jgi:hypothetical protein